MRFSVAVPLMMVLVACGGDEPSSQDLGPRDLAVRPDLTGADMAAPYGSKVGDPCHLLDQISGKEPRGGCDEGLHCAVGNAGSGSYTICIPDSNIYTAEGGACSSTDVGQGVTSDLCAPNLFCAKGAGQTQGTCRKYCLDRTACPSGQGCVISTGVVLPNLSDPETGQNGPRLLRACFVGDDCDPIAQSGCKTGQRCLFSATDAVGRIPFCTMATGNGVNDADCSSSLDCAAGYSCGTLGLCRKICWRIKPDGGTGGECPSGLFCQAVTGYPDGYGRCD